MTDESRVRRAVCSLLTTIVLLGAGTAVAQPVDIPETWGGDLWSRPRLTGSWGGFRDELGKKGIVVDADLLLTPQDVFSGGRKKDGAFWGNAEYTLNFDSQKAGLWPGGFIRVSAQSSFGDAVLGDSGALVPVNTAALLPRPVKNDTSLMNATLLQFLSTKFGVTGGKFFMFDAFAGEFSGNYRTQFQNTGLVFPMAMALVPFASFGAGVIALPWEGVVMSALAIGPDGSPLDNDIQDTYDDGVMIVASAKQSIKPFGLVGSQSVGGMWSSQNRFALDQDPSNLANLLAKERFPRLGDPGPILSRLLERFFPALLLPVQPAKREDDTWAVFYGFDQYLWQPEDDPKRGIGIFFNMGFADKKTNPIRFSSSLGIGGNGVVPGRPHDTFGVGWAHTEFSNDLLAFLRNQLDLGLHHEDAIEVYYNVAVTGWLNVSLDLQYVRTGLRRKAGSGLNLKNLDHALVGGVRAYIRF